MFIWILLEMSSGKVSSCSAVPGSTAVKYQATVPGGLRNDTSFPREGGLWILRSVLGLVVKLHSVFPHGCVVYPKDVTEKTRQQNFSGANLDVHPLAKTSLAPCSPPPCTQGQTASIPPHQFLSGCLTEQLARRSIVVWARRGPRARQCVAVCATA